MKDILKKVLIILIGIVFLSYNTPAQTTERSNTNNPYMITTEVPQRPVGQQDVIQLTAPKLEVVRVGFIGLGMRGPGAVKRFTQIPGTEIKALCDIRPERIEVAQNILKEAKLPKAAAYSDSEDAWKTLCERDDIDLVYIATDWKHHVPMALYAMEHGKHVAVEVPGAMTLEDIWALIDRSEKTRQHCMMLENCVYDYFELTTLNMAQQGLFGEIMHVEGSYIHNLEQFWTAYWDNWRMQYNKEHRGDIYPTHGMGPACQLLDIHRGDKMNYLVSMDTKAVSGPAIYKKIYGEEAKDFQNGDHTMTMIRTEQGKTIHIQHDVVSPRPYSRMYQLTGTKGFANKYPKEGYAFQSTEATKNVAPAYFCAQSNKRYVDEEIPTPYTKNMGRKSQASGRTWRYGLYYGCSIGLLPTKRFTFGYGCL